MRPRSRHPRAQARAGARRSLPNALEDIPAWAPATRQAAEEVLLGVLMLDSDGSAWREVTDMRAEVFEKPEHRRVFETIKRLAGAGKPSDVVSVFDEIQRTNPGEPMPDLCRLAETACAALEHERRHAAGSQAAS